MDSLRRDVLVKPGDSFERWHQVTCQDFSLTDCDHVRIPKFRGGILGHQFDRLTVNDIWLSTEMDERLCVMRRATDVRRDPRDYFMLWLVLDGEVVLTHGDQQADLTKGDLALHDQSQPFTLAFSASAQATIVSIPRAQLTSRLPDAHRLAARRIPARMTSSSFARSIVQQLRRGGDPAGGEGVARLSSCALDVISIAIEQSTCGELAQDRRLAGIKKYIISNLHDSHLSVDKIALANNVTPRTLSRIFAQENTTPIRWLWQQRLAASYKALSEGQIKQVTEAALSFGFADLSHFSRAFKSAFGHPPHHLKHRGADA